jgi:hypothetical protein
MSRVFIAALLCAVILGGVSFSYAYETLPPGEMRGGYHQPTNAYPAWRPSGLRFPDPVISIQTGALEGGAAGAPDIAPGPCNTCGQNGLGPCMYWTLVPWYGSWDYGQHHRAACRRCGGAIGY